MDVVDALTQLGGNADTAVLRRVTSRRVVRRAVAEGRIVQPRRGRCALPVLDETERALRRTGGVRSHLSAALHHGWPVKTAPGAPMIKVRRTSRLTVDRRAGVRLFWRTVSGAELQAGVTDSALRSGMVTRAQLREAATRSPRTGRTRAIRVAEAADGRADLVDAVAGIVIEAESWEFHGSRDAFDKDVRRYTAMVRAGWRVVRFLWDEVMHHPEQVRAVLVDVVALCQGAKGARFVRQAG